MKTKIRKIKPRPDKVDVEELRKLVKTWRENANEPLLMVFYASDVAEHSGKACSLESCADDLEQLINNFTTPDNEK